MSLLSEVYTTVVESQSVSTADFYVENVVVDNVLAEDVQTGALTSTGLTELYNTDIYGHLHFENHVTITNTADSDNNVSVGYDVGGTYTTAVNNVSIGYKAGNALTSGSNNICIGDAAGTLQTTGSNNVAIGKLALASATVGSNNIAVGETAGQASLVDNNIAIGNNALRSIAGSNNICIGTDSGGSVFLNNMGSGNILLGSNVNVEDAVGNACVIGNNSSGKGGSITIGRNTNGGTYSYLVLGYVENNNLTNTLIPGPIDNDVDASNNGVPLGGVYFNKPDAGKEAYVLQIRMT